MNLRAGACALALLGLLGCAQTQTRFQAGEDVDKDTPEVRTIGDITVVDNADPVPVSGVGLVTNLNGTGAPAPPGGFRAILENDLHKLGIDDAKEILNSRDCSLVLVSALIPAGAHKGDPLDIEVSLPEGSKTASLRGGYLQECTLFTYDSAHNVVPTTSRPDRLLKGDARAKAKGSLLVGFGDGDEEVTLKRGRIWGGGVCASDRPFYLLLANDQQYARVAMQVADRINETFQGPYRGPGSGLAEAKTKVIVNLKVPAQYSYNMTRFLRVVRLIPLNEAPAAASPYRKRLDEDLLDPARTVTAALRLEALGSDTIPSLKRGLQSEHVLVRFAAAEGLTYLGSSAGGEELARLAKNQPALRAFCLTALASLDETICHFKLQELLSETSAETRYGAFRALRALRPNDDAIPGELLNDSFWLHRVAPQSQPMVHVSTTKRAEIVLFGEDAYMEPPFSFQAGAEFTITASADDTQCTISRFSLQHGIRRKQCSLKLGDVLRRLTDLGGTYPDAVDLLRHADSCHCINCRVAVDAVPEATSVFQLARAGEVSKKKGPAEGEDELLQSDQEIEKARADFGATPNLFDMGPRKRRDSAERE
jgi:flagellar basal body P-ring protein FlgI